MVFYQPEQTTLYSTINNIAEYRCGGTSGAIGKAISSPSQWITHTTVCAPGNNQQTNNSAGLNILPAGVRDKNGGNFLNMGYVTWLWTSSFTYDMSGLVARQYNLHYADAGLYNYTASPAHGLSVRCIKN